MTKRNDVIQIRVSPEEKQAVQAKAKKRDQSVSDFLRCLVPLDSIDALSDTRTFEPTEAIPAYRCSDDRCGMTSASPHAVCSTHGRRVVSA